MRKENRLEVGVKTENTVSSANCTILASGCCSWGMARRYRKSRIGERMELWGTLARAVKILECGSLTRILCCLWDRKLLVSLTNWEGTYVFRSFTGGLPCQTVSRKDAMTQRPEFKARLRSAYSLKIRSKVKRPGPKSK